MFVVDPRLTHTLEIDSVEVSFGDKPVLQGVYLRLDTGMVTGLLGSNGCGKTTLMRILSGALRPAFKSMYLDGVWHKRFSCRQVRYLFQQGFIPGSLSVKQVFRDFELPFEGFTEFFPDLARIYTVRADALSGGERRLVECYVILRSDSQFVLLDEPFSGVMPLHIEALKRLILEEKYRKGILLTDHLYRHVTGVCDRLYVLTDGSARLAETEEDLLRYGYLRHLQEE